MNPLAGLAGIIAEKIAAILVPLLVKAIGDEISRHMPDLISAVTNAVAGMGADVSIKVADRITSVIPGHVDDQIVAAVEQGIRNVLPHIPGL